MEGTFDLLIPMTAKSTPVAGVAGYNNTLLYSAVSGSRDELVEYLLTKGNAAMKSAPDYDEHLISTTSVGAYKDAHINDACGLDQRTPLLEAIRLNRSRVVQLLLQHGADPLATTRNIFSGYQNAWGAVHVFANAGHNEDSPMIRKLVIEHKVSITHQSDGDRDGESALLLAIQNDSFELASCLLSLGADINSTCNSSGFLTFRYPTTVLGHTISTCARNSIARMRYLLSSSTFGRVNINLIVEPTRKLTALHRAAMGHLEMWSRATDMTAAEPLVWGDVDMDACREILNELLQVFHDGKEIDARSELVGRTALHLAVLAGNPEGVRLLLSHGADVAIQDEEGETALDVALRLQMEMGSVGDFRSARGMKKRELDCRASCADLLATKTGEKAV
ncbi:MAG: hypothetical protein Q9162_000315 [Coniocarpon cinnabarinum]